MAVTRCGRSVCRARRHSAGRPPLSRRFSPSGLGDARGIRSAALDRRL